MELVAVNKYELKGYTYTEEALTLIYTSVQHSTTQYLRLDKKHRRIYITCHLS